VDDELKKKTQETANKLFGKGIKMDPPYLTWKEFDKALPTISPCSSPASSIQNGLTLPKGRWLPVPCWRRCGDG